MRASVIERGKLPLRAYVRLQWAARGGTPGAGNRVKQFHPCEPADRRRRTIECEVSGLICVEGRIWLTDKSNGKYDLTTGFNV